MAIIEDHCWIETEIPLYILHTQQNLTQFLVLEEVSTLLYMLHTHEIRSISKSSKFCGKLQPLYSTQ